MFVVRLNVLAAEEERYQILISAPRLVRLLILMLPFSQLSDDYESKFTQLELFTTVSIP